MEKESWFLWIDGYHSPSTNMAVDELLLFFNLEIPILRLYRWSVPSISMGYVQKAKYIPDNTKKIVRRLTGGGFVDHTKQYTYSIIFPNGHWINKQPTLESYRLVNLAIIEMFKSIGSSPQLSNDTIPKTTDRNKMICFETPTQYDVMINKEKVAGAAQRRTKVGILHQGTISTKSISIKKIEKLLPVAFNKVFSIYFKEWLPTKYFG